MIFESTIDNKTYRVEVKKDSDAYHVCINDKSFTIPLDWNNLIELGLQTFHVTTRQQDKTWLRCFINGKALDVTIQTEQEKLSRLLAPNDERKELYTSMPGKIVKILVQRNQKVNKAEPLLVMEAMKMENIFKAPQAGFIKSICVKEGENVEAQTKLIEIIDE